jgi:hypothetical protein
MIQHPELKARLELNDSFIPIYEWDKYSKEFGVPVFVSEYDEECNPLTAQDRYMIFFRSKSWWGSFKVSKEFFNDARAIDTAIRYHFNKLHKSFAEIPIPNNQKQ